MSFTGWIGLAFVVDFLCFAMIVWVTYQGNSK